MNNKLHIAILIGLVAISSIGLWLAPSDDSFGAVAVLPDQAHTIAGERVTVRQRGNRVEAQLPWKGQPGITVSYDMGQPTPQELSKGKRNKQVITEVLSENEFKIDILLDEKPDTNVFCLALSGDEQYDFRFQDKTTDVPGSYAVYAKETSLNTTNKVWHIAKPQVWEVNNREATTIDADMSYTTGSLCVTVDQSYLDNANYPVRIDPTLGYITEGASGFGSATSVIKGYKATTTEAGTATSISWYGQGFSGTADAYGLLYNDAGTLLGTTTVVTMADAAFGTFTLYTQSLHSSIELAANTPYIIAVAMQGAGLHAFDTGGTDTDYRDSETYSQTPASSVDWDQSSGGTNRFSAYVTYTAAATTVTSTTEMSGDTTIQGNTIIQ